MKKTLFCLFAMFASAGLFAQQPVVAVAPFDAISGVNATDASMITRVFFIRLGNTNQVNLVDRSVVERVLREHNFQAGDWSNTQKTAELGSALNANWIVRGELEKFGSNILVTVQFYDIKTFRFMGGADILLASSEEALAKMDPLVDSLIKTISGSNSMNAYRIGDRGPGGGLIFFAENGVYMECSMDLGSFNWDDAIVAAQNYNGGGFTDWRLPTRGDFDLMYSNLKLNNLGGFSNALYWTSHELNARNAIVRNMGNRLTPMVRKTTGQIVRAVRTFNQ